MKKVMSILLTLALVLSFIPSAMAAGTAGDVTLERASVSATLAKSFQNNMLFQRNKPIKVWGTSTGAGMKVTVSLGSNSASTITDSSGKWTVTLSPMEAQPGLTLKMTCGDDPSTAVTRTNVAVGELIVAAGQSNMNFSVSGVAGIETILSDTVTLSEIRVFDLRETVSGAKNSPIWRIGSEISGNTGIGVITAYNIAREQNIPVGVIEAAIGSSIICSFLSPETIASRSEYDQFDSVASTETNISIVRTRASGLYNIWFPHIKGMYVGSVIWYQGEQDAQRDITSNLYSTMLYDFINQLRADFNNDSTLPIILCELAPYSHENFVNIRQSQYETAKRMNDVYIVTTSDVGPTASDISGGNTAIHPSNKIPVARRCTDVIYYTNFNKTDVAYSGPEYKNMVINGSNAVLKFSNITGYNQIFSKDMLDVNDMSYSDTDIVKRFGSSAPNTRLECRIFGSITKNQFTVTRVTPNDIKETYPLAYGGATDSKYLAKLSRTADGGMLYFGNLTSDVGEGDKVRVKFSVFPTDGKLSNGSTAAHNTVKTVPMTFAAQRGTDGNLSAGYTKNITLTMNKWNDVVVDFAVQYDSTNGFTLTLNSNDDGSFAGTIFLDGVVTVEKVKTGLYKGVKNTDSTLKGFKIAGANGVFYDATATISGDTITVSSPNVAKPVEVRYCCVPWNESDKTNLGGNLYNPQGVPASPFKATPEKITITDVTKTANNTYSVTIQNTGRNEAPGIVVAALFDGDNFVQMKTVPFTFYTADKKQENVVFNPSVTVTNPKVKVMAWKGFDTLVPYCAKVEK